MPLLSGCVAAVALPLVAGGTLYARQEGSFVRAATPADPAKTAGTPRVTLTELAELPPPTIEHTGPGPWQPFIEYALAQSAALAEAARPQSALIVPDGVLISPERRACGKRDPAVIVDLDNAGTAFAPQSDRRPDQGLAAGLARLREAGIVVLWLSELPASKVGDVAQTLRASGLDPEGKDQFLLIRWADDRKQLLREQANEDVCVIALAGDQRNDFDELFDYLRDVDAAVGLDAMIGQGWFLVPPPLAPINE